MTAATKQSAPMIRGFKLLSHHELDGFGGLGEGTAIQMAQDGRRILFLLHSGAEPISVRLPGLMRELPDGALMIRDGRRAVAIAGIMGGENSEITSSN